MVSETTIAKKQRNKNTPFPRHFYSSLLFYVAPHNSCGILQKYSRFSSYFCGDGGRKLEPPTPMGFGSV